MTNYVVQKYFQLGKLSLAPYQTIVTREHDSEDQSGFQTVLVTIGGTNESQVVSTKALESHLRLGMISPQ